MNITNLTLVGNLTVDIYDNSPGYGVCWLYSFIMNTILIGSLCIVGLVCNILSFCIFCKDSQKSATTFLFQALSIIDSLVLLAVFPLYVLDPLVEYLGVLKGFFTVQPYVLAYIFPLALTAQTASIWTTVLVALIRYIAVYKPLRAIYLCSIQRTRKYILVVIIVSILYNIPRFAQSKIVYGTQETNNGASETIVSPGYTSLGESYLYNIIYGNICYLIFLLILPLSVLTLLNVHLFKALKEQKRGYNHISYLSVVFTNRIF